MTPRLKGFAPILVGAGVIAATFTTIYAVRQLDRSNSPSRAVLSVMHQSVDFGYQCRIDNKTAEQCHREFDVRANPENPAWKGRP